MTASEIATANDIFRKLMVPNPKGRIILTSALAESPALDLVIKTVREFKDFNEDNDPHKEHDFGSFTIKGTTYCFKIDYLDLEYNFGVDPYETKDYAKVLTIMEMSER